MDTFYIFTTKHFSPTPAELDEAHEDYINPGVFGHELADYIKAGLSAHGYTVRAQGPEDWGYYLDIDHDGAFDLWIGCANLDEAGDGSCKHFVSINPKKPFVRPMRNWFRKVDVQADVEKLLSAVGEVLRSDDGIKDLKLAESP